jgi:hypothetical protein
MPVLAILLSVLGLIPFILCGLAALGPDAETAPRMMAALIGYAAVILAFAGGIHWGFALHSPKPGTMIGRAPLALAALAPLVGWLGLLLPLVASPWVSLLLLTAAYIAQVLLEQETSKRELLPRGYLWLRWGFTLVAVAVMVTVLTLRFVGLSLRF